MSTNPESLADSAAFVLIRPAALALTPVRTASDLRPVMAAVASLEESASQWAKRDSDVAAFVADVYREAAHAVRAAVEEVRLSE